MMNIEIDILSPDVFANEDNWLLLFMKALTNVCLIERSIIVVERYLAILERIFKKIEHITGKIIIFAVSKTWRI